MSTLPRKRSDIRALLVAQDVTMADIGRECGVSKQRVAQAIDDPNPNNARDIKRVVARRAKSTLQALWPWPQPQTNGGAA